MMWPFPVYTTTNPSTPVPLINVRPTLCQEMAAHDASRGSNPQTVLNRVVYDSLLAPDDPVGVCGERHRVHVEQWLTCRTAIFWVHPLFAGYGGPVDCAE